MSDSSLTALKPCDTYPPPQNRAVRVGTRQLDGLKIHSSSNSSITDDLDDPCPPPPAARGANSSASITHHRSVSSPSTNSSGSSGPSSGSNIISAVGKINTPTPVSPPRHFCMRHRRTADEGTNLKLQKVCPSISLSCPSRRHSPYSLFLIPYWGHGALGLVASASPLYIPLC
jgi:hypothetical protein